MWSDEIDKKIKKTAEGYHQPAYDDKAWDNMEVLLDKHLPIEKRRKWFIIFWLLPLALIGTGIYFIIQKQPGKGITQEKAAIAPPTGNTNPVSNQTGLTTDSKETITKPSSVKDQLVNSSTTKKVKSYPQQRLEQTGSSPEEKLISKVSEGEPVASKEVNDKNNKLIPDINTQISASNPTKSVPDADITSVSKDVAGGTAVKENKEADSIKSNEAVIETKTQKPKSSFASKITFNISAGPDISIVGLDNPGSWNLQFGVGLSYAISKKISIRTGFFTGHKIYTADSADYHSKYVPPNLQKVDANCTVYEIPVNLIYNFPATKKHNWFISGGLSSYLMKKEIYDYYYINNWGQMRIYNHTYTSENTHLFSVINLSGGYQYHFNDRFSILTEPYARIPISGIGHGKVNLNSAGILFTAGFKPFLKSK